MYVRTVTVTLPSEAVSPALFRLQRLNNQWTHAGVPAWESTHRHTEGDQVTLTLHAPLPVVDGLTLVGRHVRGEGFVPAPGLPEALHVFPDDPACTHCGTRRAKRHYVLTRDGEHIFLGANCCEAYFTAHGAAAPHDLAEMLADPAQLLSATAANVAASPHPDTLAVIAAAIWADREANGDRHWARELLEQTVERAHLGEGKFRWPAEVSDGLLRAAMLQMWATEEYTADSEFAARLREAAGRPTATRHVFGLLASLPRLHRRERRLADAAAAGLPTTTDYATGFVGQIGERLTIDKVLIEQTRPLDTGSTLVIMRTHDGHRMTWFASSPFGLPEQYTAVRVTGTVKKHETYRGVDGTVLNRCVFAPA